MSIIYRPARRFTRHTHSHTTMSRCSSFLWRRTREALFLLIGFTVAICKEQSEENYTPLDSTVELDLLFPRPNETYKRAYPFPIILVSRA